MTAAICQCVFLFWAVKVLALIIRLCPTLCDPMDYSPPGSSVHGNLQARIPEWVAISYSGLQNSWFNHQSG